MEVQAPTTQHNANTNRGLAWHVSILIDPAVKQRYIDADIPSAIVLKRTLLQRKREARSVEC